MHKSLLSTHRTVVVMDGVQTMRERPLSGSPAVLRAEAGVIADLLGCEEGWCTIALAGEEGWVRESASLGRQAAALSLTGIRASQAGRRPGGAHGKPALFLVQVAIGQRAAVARAAQRARCGRASIRHDCGEVRPRS